MILDNALAFSNPQTVTTSTNTGLKSTSSVDLGVARNIGAGEPLCVVVAVTTALAMDSTQGLRVTLTTDDNTNFSSAVEVQEIGTLAANSAAGTVIVARLSPKPGLAYERYIDLLYKVTTGSALSAGALKAFICSDADAQTYYASGYTIRNS